MNVRYFVLATGDRPNYPAGLPINIVSNINWTAMYWGLDTADRKLQARFNEIASETDLVVYVCERCSDEIEPLNPEQDERAADEFAKRNAERLRRESEWAERRQRSSTSVDKDPVCIDIRGPRQSAKPGRGPRRQRIKSNRDKGQKAQ